ncbi:MAG: VIT1/CCC1 transporter family protein, partial [Candidatus Odinarchaeota archaeon]
DSLTKGFNEMSLGRDLEKAREAYKNKDLEATIKAHSLKLAREDHQQEQGKYIKSVVYGGLDGIITTFAVVAGVTGAALSAGIVLILGLANLIADGLSMAIGDYLSTKAEREYQEDERRREAWEVENYPEGEKQELVELYMEKGLTKEDASSIVSIISRNKSAWIDIMMVEELGILESDESPVKNALVTFISFAVFGSIPLVVYILSLFIPLLMENPFFIFFVACTMTGLTLFALGALKVRVTGKKWFVSGFEMLVVGGLAAIAAFGIGVLLSGLA